MNYFYDVTTSKNILPENPTKTMLKLSKGTIDYVSIFFPFGCASLVGVQIWVFDYQMFPTNRNNWYIGDNILIPISSVIEIAEEPFSLLIKTYNEDDLYQHTVYFNVNMVKNIISPNVTKFIQSLRINL